MNEVVRILADWFEDGTNGINALLPSVPRTSPDPQPANVTVYDETRDNRPARDRLPEEGLPALVVATRSVVVIPENVIADDGQFSGEVQVQYAASDLDAFEARRDGNTVLRAALWSLRRFRLLAVDAAARSKNNIVLLDIGPVRFVPWFQEVEDTKQVGTLLVPVTGRDTYAL